MVLRIERDQNRFKEIIRGRIKQDFRKYITRGELIGRQGGKTISIPVPSIDSPHFRHGKNQGGGGGPGDGDAGEPGDAGQPGEGSGAGEDPGQHILDVDVTLDELAEILGEELQLPRIEPRGDRHLQERQERYTSIRATGPESLRHFRRTFRRALRRQIVDGTYDPDRPLIVPVKEDRRYRAAQPSRSPRANAVIIYVMDVSGSMGDEQKEIVRIESFWIDTWLRHHYKDLEIRYLVHDAAAREVDRETFYHLRESGGTKISSAYQLLAEIIAQDYPTSDWNVYPFHFSDGDNWGSGDTDACVKLLEEALLPASNLFCYGQVESPYGSGQFLKDLQAHFPEHEALATSHIAGKDGIYDSIREFLGHGR
jgi:uncharacterized sporulation protein YeaH/YhbH (DUF444 family)